MYATTANLSRRLWLKEPANKDVKSKKKTQQPKWKWPIFYEFSVLEQDSFWVSCWLTAAKGSFPSGFSFNGHELLYSWTRKTSVRVVFNKDKTTLLEMCKLLYQEQAGIYSPADRLFIKQKEDLAYDPEMSNITSWTSGDKATLKSQQQTLVNTFVATIAETYSLSKEQIKSLQQTIWTGINVDCFTKNNIIIQNNQIVNIIGLNYDPETQQFYIDTSVARYVPKKPNNSTSKKSNKLNFLDDWKSFTAVRDKKKVNMREIAVEDLPVSVSSSHRDSEIEDNISSID